MHTERQVQLASWREQRSQLTQALHMWAARSGGAKQRVADAQASLAAENLRLPEAEKNYRLAQEQLSEARSRQLQAENRLLLEQQNGAHLEGSLQSLGQRRERLEAELQSLAEPDAAGMNAANERILQLDREIGAAQAALDALQAEAEALGSGERRRRRCPCRGEPRAHGGRRPARDLEAGAGRGRRGCAAACLAGAPSAGGAAALLAEDTHRARLGNRGGVGAAGAPARAGAR